MKFTLIFFLLTFSILSSAKDRYTNIDSILITPFQQSSDTIFEYAYVDIEYYDNFLFVLDRKTKECVKILDSKSLECISTLGIDQNNRELFLLPGHLHIDPINNILSVLDKQGCRIRQFYIVTDQKSIDYERTIKLEGNIFTSFAILNDSLCAYSDYFDDMVIRVFNYETNTLQKQLNIPVLDSVFDFSKISVTTNNYYDWKLDYSNSFLFISSRLSNKIVKYDVKEQEFSIINGPEFKKSDSALFSFDNIDNSKKVRSCEIKEGNYGFIDIAFGERYIYGLYSGEKRAEGMNANLILVYDYSGKLTKKYYFVEKGTLSITIDEKEGVLYTLNMDLKQNNNNVKKYKLDL